MTAVDPHVRSIIAAGVLAPSAENRHYIEFQESAACILLFGTAAYFASPYHRRLLNLLSVGAVVENMTIRAMSLGYRTDVRWHLDATAASPIAELRLVKTEGLQTKLDGAVAGRHTNRRVVFSGPQLNEGELSRFTELLNGIDGVRLRFFDSAGERAKLLRLMRLAEAVRFNTRALHEEVFSSIRFDVGWNAPTEEGLPPAALGVEPGLRWAFSQLRHWPLVKALSHIGFHQALGFRVAALPCRLAPHRGLLSTTLPLERGLLAVGQALQRIWLDAETRGLAFQPFASPGMHALAEFAGVPAKTRNVLAQGWKELTEETPVMVFRLGHADRPAIRANRRPAEFYIRPQPGGSRAGAAGPD